MEETVVTECVRRYIKATNNEEGEQKARKYERDGCVFKWLQELSAKETLEHFTMNEILNDEVESTRAEVVCG